MTQVELIVDARAGTGEGPVWDERTRKLVWVETPTPARTWRSTWVTACRAVS